MKTILINDVSAQIYPGARRMNAIFAAALEHPVPASALGDQIREIVDDESWTLRYPAGLEPVISYSCAHLAHGPALA